MIADLWRGLGLVWLSIQCARRYRRTFLGPFCSWTSSTGTFWAIGLTLLYSSNLLDMIEQSRRWRAQLWALCTVHCALWTVPWSIGSFLRGPPHSFSRQGDDDQQLVREPLFREGRTDLYRSQPTSYCISNYKPSAETCYMAKNIYIIYFAPWAAEVQTYDCLLASSSHCYDKALSHWPPCRDVS